MRHSFVGLILVAGILIAFPAASTSTEPLRMEQASLRPSFATVPLDAAGVSTLLVAASVPENTPSRRESRDRLFRGFVPRMHAEGLAASRDDLAAMPWALGSTPCASAPLRVAEAHVLGDAALVRIAGPSGGCKVLLRRVDGGWGLVMVLGWTLTS